MDKIYSVCWNIIEKCNENCEFCYRTVVDDLDLDSNKKIADKLIEHGVKKITFAGGEPLLYKDLFELAEYIKSKDSNIILSLTTNGMLISNDVYDKILSLFDWITFDIESTSIEYHEKVGRGKNHLPRNIENLIKFNNKIHIKINTVATQQNIADILLIWQILKKFNIQRWKIFRYYPITYKAKDNESIFSISDEQFETLKNDILLLTNSKNIQLDFNDTADFKTTYFSIFPNGTLKDNTGNVTCNILEDSIDECISSIDLTNHIVRKRAFEKFTITV